MHAISKVHLTFKTMKDNKMEILTDKTIDPLTAKYFCMFANKELIQFLAQVKNDKNIDDMSKKLIAQNKKNQSLDESTAKRKISFINEDWFSNKLKDAKNQIDKAKENAENSMSNIIAKSSGSATQTVVDTVTSAANQEKLAGLASKAGHEASAAAVDTAIDKLNANQEAFKKMANDVGASAGASAGSSATQAAIDTLAANNAQLDQLANSAGASATQGAVDTLASNNDKLQQMAKDAGASATSGALSSLKKAASSALSLAMPWLIGAAITTISAVLWPKIKGGFKKMFRTSAKTNNSLAFVKFKDVDENDWQFYFSKDKMLWKLDNMNSGEDVTRQNTLAFMQTNFAKTFMARSQQFIRNILDDETNSAILLKQQEKDNELRKELEYLVNNKNKIYDRMFNGKC